MALTRRRILLFFSLFLLAVGNSCLIAETAETPELQDLGENWALGKSYTWNPPPDAFPNGYGGNPMCRDEGDAVQLTDGQLADRCWWDKRTVGWWAEHRIDITFDLVKEVPVGVVAIHLSSEIDAKRIPKKVLIFSSNDKKTWHLAGELTADEANLQWEEDKDEGKQDGNPHCWIVKKGLKTKGRYIMLSFWSASLYLDEVRIYSGGLKADDIAIPKDKTYDTTDIFPFVEFSRLYVAKEVCLPLFLILPKEIRRNDKEGLSLFVDLPEGVLVKAPMPVAPVEDVVEGEQKWKRHKLKNVRVLFLQSQLPEGTVGKARFIAADSEGNKESAGRIQTFDVETISIPAVSLPKKLRVSVAFANFPFWASWPDVVANYKHLGLNVFMPFCGADGYWYFIQKGVLPGPKQMIRTAKDAGLIVGAWSSPFCLGGKSKDKAVYLGGNQQSGTMCPRAYMKPQGGAWVCGGEVDQQVAPAANGVEFFLFDSEPYWGGKICVCPICRADWKVFLEKRKVAIRDMNDVWRCREGQSAEDLKYIALLQEFWDEFYCRLWGTFKTRMDNAAPKDSTISLGLYNCPHNAEEFNYSLPVGNHGRFLPLYHKGILTCAVPSNYTVRTKEYGALIRALREKIPASCPLYPIVGSGGGNFSIPWKKSPAERKQRLFEIFCNGGQGFHFWAIAGFKGDDYQAVCDVLRRILPYEDLIAEGRPIQEGLLVPNDPTIKANGITDGTESLILISRYGKRDPFTAKVTLDRRLLDPGRAELKSVFNAEKVMLNNGQLAFEFNGTPEDFVKVVYVK